jgi:superfamily II DNA or RNA helicase
MAFMIAKALQDEDPDLVFGWVAMRRNLLRQAEKENISKGFNIQNIHYVSMFDNRPDTLLKAKESGRRICLIIDEAQHDAASSMSHIHNLILPDLVLGMTATPFRTDRMKLCFNNVIKDYGIHELIQDGYLAPYEHYSIPDWAPETVAKHYCSEPDRWGKSIFFFNTIGECTELHKLLTDRGVRSELVIGGQQKTTDAQLEMFEDGQIDCLINCMVLTEGFDCPSIRTAWIRDSSKGPTMQMGGRVFRQHPSISHKQIVQSHNTSWPFIRTAMPIQQFKWIDDSWRTLKVNPELENINNLTIMAIATTTTDMPKFIIDGKDKGKKKKWTGLK